jgi:hypothetical protein
MIHHRKKSAPWGLSAREQAPPRSPDISAVNFLILPSLISDAPDPTQHIPIAHDKQHSIDVAMFIACPKHLPPHALGNALKKAACAKRNERSFSFLETKTMFSSQNVS